MCMLYHMYSGAHAAKVGGCKSTSETKGQNNKKKKKDQRLGYEGSRNHWEEICPVKMNETLNYPKSGGTMPPTIINSPARNFEFKILFTRKGNWAELLSDVWMIDVLRVT